MRGRRVAPSPLPELFEERAKIARELGERLASVDERIARALANATGPHASGPDAFTSRSPPAGMKAPHFNARCRRLKGAGDTRVHKEGRVWVAEREVFTLGASRGARPALAMPSSATPFDLDGEIEAGARPARRRE